MVTMTNLKLLWGELLIQLLAFIEGDVRVFLNAVEHMKTPVIVLGIRTGQIDEMILTAC